MYYYKERAKEPENEKTLDLQGFWVWGVSKIFSK